MAFIKCPKCRSLIDSDREICPYCGCVIKEKEEDEEEPDFSYDEDNSVDDIIEEPVVEDIIDDPFEGIEKDPFEGVYKKETKTETFQEENIEVKTEKPWIEEYKRKSRRAMAVWGVIFSVLAVLAILFWSLYGSDRETIPHNVEYEGMIVYSWNEEVINYNHMIAATIFGCAAICALVLLIYALCSRTYVRHIKGYDVVIYHHYSWKLVIEGKEVDSAYYNRGYYHFLHGLKLSGRLPDNTLIVANIRFDLGETFIDIETGEK